MRLAWTMTGEAAKALDATPRSLEAMGVEDLRVYFYSGRTDRMTWSVPLPSADGTGIIAPELRQAVTLFRAGARFFTGHCTRRRMILDGENWYLQIEVSGPWWWMEQIALTSTQTDQAGNNATRMAFVFGAGSLGTSFGALATRSIALGVPVVAGTVATMFDFPRITITGEKLSGAYLALLRCVPDSMLAFDYSVVGLPSLKVTRRKTGLAAGSAATRTITMGTDNVMSCDLQPMIELEVSSVRIDSASRDSQARALWQTSFSGVAANGQNQIFVVSGPEIGDTTLPPDEFDSVVVGSKLIKPSGILSGEIFETYDPRLKAAGVTGLAIGPFTVNTTGGGTYTLPAVTPSVEKRDGGALPVGRTRFLTQGEPKDWWTKDGIGWEMARATATLYTTVVSPVPVPNGYSPNPPDWVETLGMQHSFYSQTVAGVGQKRTDVYYYTAAVLFPAVNTAWAAGTTIYREEDYSYVNPPAGLAANLLATQNFIPYEGTVELLHEDVPAGNPVGTCINIAGGPAELAGARVMVQAAEMDIQNGIERLTGGASPRDSYADLVRRFRRSGFDSYDFISNPGLGPS